MHIANELKFKRNKYLAVNLTVPESRCLRLYLRYAVIEVDLVRSLKVNIFVKLHLEEKFYLPVGVTFLTTYFDLQNSEMKFVKNYRIQMMMAKLRSTTLLSGPICQWTRDQKHGQ